MKWQTFPMWNSPIIYLLKPCLCNSDIYYLYTIKAFIYILYILVFQYVVFYEANYFNFTYNLSF